MPRKTVAIIGAGLAGLSAAAEWNDIRRRTGEAWDIHLFESSLNLGGRTTSHFFKEEGVWLDNAQHVTMRCCDALLGLLRRTGLLEFWTLQDRLTFALRPAPGKDGTLRFFPFQSGSGHPPWNLLPSLWNFRFLPVSDRIQLALLLRKLLKARMPEGWNVAEWLGWYGCSPRNVRYFFDPVLISAFSAQMENISVKFAQTVLRKMFAESTDGWNLLVPQRPLRDIFDEKLGKVLAEQGVHIHRKTAIRQIRPDTPAKLTCAEIATSQTSEFLADRVILAVPWNHAGDILPQLLTKKVFRKEIFFQRNIASVHFWTRKTLWNSERFPNLVTPGETIQWIFQPSYGSCDFGTYYQALISDAENSCSTRPETLAQVVFQEIGTLFPGAEITRIRATCCPAVFTPDTGVDHERPTFATPFPNIFLAGDWTATGLPATMEGAVQSGVTAARESAGFVQHDRSMRLSEDTVPKID